MNGNANPKKAMIQKSCGETYLAIEAIINETITA
jgi:hypothetical protein